MEIKRIQDVCGRDSTFFSNDLVRLVVEDHAGMTPELSYRHDQTYVNTHFVPHFRGSSCQFDPEKHQAWGIRLAHELAGNWPCFPTFGNPSYNRDYDVPPCGHTANNDWVVTETGADETACWQRAVMGPDNAAGIEYTKYDILLRDQPVHYQVIKLKNHREEVFNFGGAWHNTTGQPFVEKGCRIAASADLYHTPPVSHDPEQRERLELDRTFESLKSAPARDGSTIDLSVVPGLNGYTDFLTGRIPQSADLGWMSVLNPTLNSIYLTFFHGPASVPADEFTFYFNHLWLQYGGRNYLPWSKYDGGVDQTLAVGVESAISAWGYGLDYCDEHPELMGNPTMLPLQPGEEKTLYQGTLVTELADQNLQSGIQSVRREKGVLILTAEDGKETTLSADAQFEQIKAIIAKIG